MGGFVDQRVNAKGEVAPPRPRVYSDKLPQNVEQDKSEMVGPIFAIADTRTFGMESDLHHKIVRSEYFKCLYVFKTFSKVVDVIQKKVTCVAPWTYRGTQKRGRWKTPSSAFCLLLKLFHLRLTQVQVEELLNHPDSPYIRALGMLYVRFGADAASLWKLLGPYCDDNQVFKPQGNEETTCTIGEFAQRLLTQTEPFFETPLPRVPKQLELRLLRHLQLSEEMVARARRNTRFFGTEKLRKGATGFLCCAQNFFAVDDDKPLTLVWRTDGVIESVLDPRRDRGANTQHAAYPTFQVRFQQDDSNALAKLGMIEFPPENDDDWKERESRQAAAELLLKKKRIKHDETSSKRCALFFFWVMKTLSQGRETPPSRPRKAPTLERRRRRRRRASSALSRPSCRSPLQRQQNFSKSRE